MLTKLKRLKKSGRTVCNLKKDYLSGLKSALRNLPWDTVFVDNDIDASTACWYDMFLSCVDEFVPKVVIKDANRPPRIDKEVLLLIRKKNRTRRKVKLKDSVNLWERFRELGRQVKKMVEFKKRGHLTKLSSSLRDNPRKFWSYYKAITKTTRILGVIKHESVEATRPIDQANLFNVFFHLVFATPDSSSAAVCLPRLNYSVKRELSEVCLNPRNILKQLQSLEVNKASLGLPSKLGLRYADYSICPLNMGHFLKNGKTQILSLFINVSLRRWFQTSVVFRFLMFYLKFWKDKFIMKYLVLFAPVLPTGTMVSYQENPLSLNYLKLFINSLTLLRGENKSMLFI